MKSQDILVAVKLLLLQGERQSFAELGKSLKISSSEAHGAVQRLKESFLLDSLTGMIRKGAFEEFLISGVKYSFPTILGMPARGVLTGYSSPFMNGEFGAGKELYIWPYSSGKDRGTSIEPLYRTVPEICLNDNDLYHWLSVIDMFRMNKARETEIAIKHMKQLLKDL